MQVSDVKQMVQQGNGIMIYWLYSTFVGSGMSILVVMDVLSICVMEDPDLLHTGKGNLHEISPWSLRFREY
jgi:hypothetical protein